MPGFRAGFPGRMGRMPSTGRQQWEGASDSGPPLPSRGAFRAMLGCLTLEDDPVREGRGQPVNEAQAVWVPAPGGGDPPRLQELLQQLPAFFGLYRGPGHLIEFSTATRLTLLDTRGQVGVPLRQACPQLDGTGWHDAWDRVFTTGQALHLRETSARAHPSDDAFFFNLSLLPRRDAQGQVEGVLAFAVDVTELVETRRAAWTTASWRTERLQAMTAALSEALTPAQVVEVAAREGAIALGALTGLVVVPTSEAADVFERVAAHGFAPGDLEDWQRFDVSSTCPLTDVTRTREPSALGSWTECMARYPRLAMLPRTLALSAWASVPLVSGGRVLGALGLGFGDARDFDEAERAFLLTVARQCAQALDRARLYDEERAARGAAEAASRAKDAFLAMVSHELRTPLTSILGWSQMLRQGLLGEDKRQRAVEAIERNARAQRQLIEDLLDISRIANGRLRLEPVPLELGRVVEAALDAVRPTALARELELEFSVDSDGVPLFGDPDRLQQVVWNLLANAIKFTPPGGRVSVSARTRDEGAELVVKDDGEGIPTDFVPFLFQRFHQADTSVSRQHGGLGLGLSIVRHLVELHGGAVSAASEGPGRGSTFTVFLPRSRVGATPGATREPRPVEGLSLPRFPELEGQRVLVVDGAPDAREWMSVLLTRVGAHVLTATNVTDAMDEVRRSPPTVLVTDVTLSGEDGYSLLYRLRALPWESGGGVPALAVTAAARREDRDRALRAGFSAFVTKPLDAVELLTAVARLAPPIPPRS
ncbi:response regulator [Corallococcus praedator]|uniref:histidine kinase n=1 Tax=Corallococcus praedator TaxID=2316724 RepID=A0ABX9QHK5_9BACT|nr:response regulator [Corallococcus sp. CA031C]RKI06087.1 response regulator [Corallococcus praedator]